MMTIINNFDELRKFFKKCKFFKIEDDVIYNPRLEFKDDTLTYTVVESKELDRLLHTNTHPEIIVQAEAGIEYPFDIRLGKDTLYVNINYNHCRFRFDKINDEYLAFFF